jgi:hypothetical protein
VSVPAGGVTTAGGQKVFTNTLMNGTGASDTITLTAPVVPTGFTAEVSTNGGTSYTTVGGAASTTVTVAANSNVNLLVRITAPTGIAVLTGYSTTIRATSGNTTQNY